jgi:integrase
LVLKALEPIWTTKAETASRLRGRIETILDWATVREHRSGENPARWRGHLKNALPRRSIAANVKHHEAVPYAELPSFMADLAQREGVSARALEFTILTGVRTCEAIRAKWVEIDSDQMVWTIPAVRMKAKKEHRVPLCEETVKVLECLPRGDGEYVFPGARAGKPLSNMAMLELVRGMRGMGVTVHGFRSTFRDWAAEQTGHPDIVVEMALAHTIGDKVEAAYRRGELFQKRKSLMADWAEFCAAQSSSRNMISEDE